MGRWVGSHAAGCILHPAYEVYTVGSILSVSLLIDENDSSVLSRGRAPRGLEPLSSDAKGKACLLQAVPP